MQLTQVDHKDLARRYQEPTILHACTRQMDHAETRHWAAYRAWASQEPVELANGILQQSSREKAIELGCSLRFAVVLRDLADVHNRALFGRFKTKRMVV